VCTVVVSLVPADGVPLLLLGFRDEFTGRPWQPPARHWPPSPLIGGRDEQAGGTWLALHPAIPRASCILNARGQLAAPESRRSRGELPLHAAEEGQPALRRLCAEPATLTSYDPFFLLCADLSSVLLLSWDGSQAALEELRSGTHVITNVGHTFPAASAGPPDSRAGHGVTPGAGAVPDAKAAHFGPKFAAHRPSGDPAAAIDDAWGDWLALADGDGLAATDPAAVIVRRELPDGRVWGTTSVSLVALGRDGLRYDFQPVPANPATWYPVGLASQPSADLATQPSADPAGQPTADVTAP
jgi:Transport and Golgi organisation 2